MKRNSQEFNKHLRKIGFMKGIPSWNKGLKKKLDFDYIKYAYLEEQKSYPEIAKELKVSETTIRNRLEEISIKRRKKHTERTKQKLREVLKENSIFVKDNPMKYIENKRKIGIKASLRYKDPIFREKHRLSCKNYYAVHKHPLLGKSKTKEQKEKMSEARKKWYINNPEKAKQKSNKTKNTLIKYGIRTLERNPNWNGGISFEPYPITFNKKFKDLIRKRDNYLCLKCGKNEIQEGKKLSVHHINYNKLLTILENCCALCNRCNIEVNNNRIHWIKFFQSLLSEKYGYKYSSDEEIIIEYNGGETNGKSNLRN